MQPHFCSFVSKRGSPLPTKSYSCTGIKRSRTLSTEPPALGSTPDTVRHALQSAPPYSPVHGARVSQGARREPDRWRQAAARWFTFCTSTLPPQHLSTPPPELVSKEHSSPAATNCFASSTLRHRPNTSAISAAGRDRGLSAATHSLKSPTIVTGRTLPTPIDSGGTSSDGTLSSVSTFMSSPPPTDTTASMFARWYWSTCE